MPISTNCPGCNVNLTLCDDRAGESMPCPKCDTTVKVPQLEAETKPPRKGKITWDWLLTTRAGWKTMRPVHKVIIGVVSGLFILFLLNGGARRSYTKYQLDSRWINVPMNEIEAQFGRNGDFGIGNFGEVHWIVYSNSVVDGRNDDGTRGDVCFSGANGRCYDVRIVKMRSQLKP